MISEKLQNAINEQISAEMWSSNLYLSMSFYFEREGFSGFAHWMKKQSQEEMGHAYAMADYIIKRGGIADMMIRRNVESYTIPLKISAREETISSVGPMTSVT